MPKQTPITLADIELACEDYAASVGDVHRVIATMEREIAQVRERYLPELRGAVGVTDAEEDKLAGLLRRGKALFDRPKSRVFHGVRVGWRKGQDTVEMPADADLVPVIEIELPELAEALIDREPTVRKSAIKNLSDDELRRIGVRRVLGAEAVSIIVQDSDETRLAAALSTARGLVGGTA